MPDHVHWLFQLGSSVTLSTAMKAFKARSAQRLNEKLGRSGSIWQKAYYDHALRGDEDMQGIARYIVGNPLRAGLVDRIGDYPHWDAVWL
jgi:REP element-mobilizing transposase RayT